MLRTLEEIRVSYQYFEDIFLSGDFYDLLVILRQIRKHVRLYDVSDIMSLIFVLRKLEKVLFSQSFKITKNFREA